MARFEINGKDYELKLTYASVKHLDGLFEGGSLGVVGKAMSGDLNAFPHIVHAALFHTGENIALKDVEAAIEKLFEAEQLDLDVVLKLSNEVITESFFYKKTVTKLMAKNPEAMKELKELVK
ncbi:tail assembly chaperone [Heyndrickxia sporothermodurans]|uniref:tail assembly chaperone n=1 Tax=Heyndrickxia sporothermodurans TaxID=46224 RepID=UPI002E2196FA|nr:tail assembly chaperone [Heyndrickxia sporothermodurans]MED3697936.1 tail assembly chaperone [Heyndrickxia sporothermodurans]